MYKRLVEVKENKKRDTINARLLYEAEKSEAGEGG